MVWNKSTITNVGLNLIARAELGENVTITNCKLSSHDYSSLTIEALKQLSDIEDIEQTQAITERKVIDNSKVRFTANFDNSELTTGYDLYTYGVYGHIGDSSDVLILVAVGENPEHVPAINVNLWQALINSIIPISTTENITINIDPAANATQQYVQDYVKSKLESEVIVTIPADDPEDSPYTENTDSDSNTYYTIEIPVTGVTSSYKGVRDSKPVYPRPYNVEGKAAVDELRALIQDGDSLEGKIKLYFNEKPDTSFQIYLYGV